MAIYPRGNRLYSLSPGKLLNKQVDKKAKTKIMQMGGGGGKGPESRVATVLLKMSSFNKKIVRHTKRQKSLTYNQKKSQQKHLNIHRF